MPDPRAFPGTGPDRRSWRGLVAVGLGLIILVGCGTSTKLIRRGGPSLAEARARRADGPQARLALVRVTSRAKSAGRLVCQGLGDMLTTALFQTGRFIVLERRRLGPVLAEQKLGRSLRVDPKTAATPGKLEGAELLMMVSVARFSRRELTFGGALVGAVSVIGSILARLAVRDNRMPIFGVAYLTSTIWLDVKLVDASTGRVVLAGRVEGLGRDWGGGALVTIPQLPLVLGHFNKTAMGRAIAEAVTLAAAYVAKKAPRQFFHARAETPLSGQVLPVQPLRVFGARGSAALGRTIIVARNKSTLASLLVQLGAQSGRGEDWADFSREMVAVVLSGARPTAGHGVWVERVVNEPREIVVYARETIPPPGIKVRTVTTYPAAVVRLPKVDKPVRLVWLGGVRAHLATGRPEPINPTAIPAITGRGRLIPVRSPLRPRAGPIRASTVVKNPVPAPPSAPRPAPGAPPPPADGPLRPWW